MGTDTRPGGLGRFGVRSIDSLYYLMYAIHNGLPEGPVLDLIRMTLIAVSVSFVNGIIVKPTMSQLFRYCRRFPLPRASFRFQSQARQARMQDDAQTTCWSRACRHYWALTRQITLPTSSATSSAPCLSSTTPTGRP